MDDKKVTIPLMVRPDDDIQFVEEDNETASENEPSTVSKRNSENPDSTVDHVYNEITPQNMPMSYLGVPKLSSRSTSTESSDGALPMLVRVSSGRKKHHHDYEKLSVTSGASKKSTVERITDGSFFRRRHEMYDYKRSDKGEDEEHILEALRHIVRKCTSIDPVKRPSSTDVLDLLSTFNEKS